ncbi:hypothetical protein DICVIV_13812 [Dictyocaulus viviparus]|uniref:Uncharacterized protein n=1 Tax=Dictyocaulus viviparus TaxID=29172 RepID=A0A0D8X930_DICVI|nr:hypothetical protein DICVIV_13812 [Dictyocaulus viviparus]
MALEMINSSGIEKDVIVNLLINCLSIHPYGEKSEHYFEYDVDKNYYSSAAQCRNDLEINLSEKKIELLLTIRKAMSHVLLDRQFIQAYNSSLWPLRDEVSLHAECPLTVMISGVEDFVRQQTKL